MLNILSLPLELRPSLPTNEGNIAYSASRRDLLRIVDMLVSGGLVSDFLPVCLV